MHTLVGWGRRGWLGMVTLTLTAVACSKSQQQPAQRPSEEGSVARVAGGNCEYVDVVGKCTVTAIEDASADDFQCEGGSKKVRFEFAADDASAKLEHGGADPASGTLTAGGGQLPSMGWLQSHSVEQGASFSCTRSHIAHGTCSPVVWKFPALELDDAPCR